MLWYANCSLQLRVAVHVVVIAFALPGQRPLIYTTNRTRLIRPHAVSVLCYCQLLQQCLRCLNALYA